MTSVEEKIKTGGLLNGAATLFEEMKMLREFQDQSGARKAINSELWHACAGPLASLPQVGSLVYYFPQGHSEQVSASTKRIATSHIPNYPNLSSQLMCQVHNVTLHADKETDEIYAQMSLQPLNSEKDVFPFPDFGLKPSKHPSEFFCKTLTASDTSTHGGFSVPRRAAEKLFPPLDYSMQPPTQELIVRDLHDNSWTFRHIYRGQPKRHLLTTGWSLFVGSKRLRAGDAVLFIRDEKSQLLVGVRRANRQQAAMPSSVLSADSMHIGVLAAAAHAAANRSPFTIFYNPRACPSEFVIPLSKYQKAVYGTQVSIGMRFGMMFETEESSKRRYMGTIVGTSDLDPLRWPGSKWRNLQVEWDEPGCGDKQNRVSLWEIDTPESLFIFPSLTSCLKRPFHPGVWGTETEWDNLTKRSLLQIPENGNEELSNPSISTLRSEHLIKMLLKSQNFSSIGAFSSVLPACVIRGAPVREAEVLTQALVQPKLTQTVVQPKCQVLPTENVFSQDQNPPQPCLDQPCTVESNLTFQTKIPASNKSHSQISSRTRTENSEMAPVIEADQPCQMTSQNLVNQLLFLNQSSLQSQTSQPFLQLPLEPKSIHTQHLDAPQLDGNCLNGLLTYPTPAFPSLFFDTDDSVLHPSTSQSLAGIPAPPESLSGYAKQDNSMVYPESSNPVQSLSVQEMWSPQLNYLRYLSQEEQLAPSAQQNPITLQSSSGLCIPRDFSEESSNKGNIDGGIHFNASTGGSNLVDPSGSITGLDDFCAFGDASFQNPSDCLVGNISSSQDVQSQITTASLADSQGFSLQEFPDNSGGTSSSNVDFEDSSLLHKGSWHQVPLPLRTYTKVQKLGSVGRSIDVTRFKDYDELRSAIACMFGLEGLLDDPRGSEWKLVYVDYENDVLLVGDDPWEEFVGCVRCIRILSPSEVQQMREDGMQLLDNSALQVTSNAVPENGRAWDG